VLALDESPPRCLFVALSNVAAGVDVSRFQEWYESVHRPDSFEAGLFHASSRYQARSPSRASVLTLWEADYTSEEEALALVRPATRKMYQQGRIWPVGELLLQHFVFLVHATPGFRLRDLPNLSTLQNDWRQAQTGPAPQTWWKQRVERTVPAEELRDGYALYASASVGSEKPGRTFALLARELSPEASGDAQRGLRFDLPAGSACMQPAHEVFCVCWERISHASLR